MPPVSLNARLAEIIRASGPLTVGEYMAQCNAHYYATRDPFGAGGDFITAPEISQIFGELIGAWLLDGWRRTGSPKAALCELGPGRGTLMKDLLRATRGDADFHKAIDVHLVETSPALRSLQRENLHDAHPRIVWHDSVDTLPPLPLLLVANEFFDALPVEQHVKAGDIRIPRRIGLKGDALIRQPEGGDVRETSPASLAVAAALAAHIRRHAGAALIIDYGYARSEQGDTLQAVKNHRHVDPLACPGEADLTAHVDFAALKRAAWPTPTWGAEEQGAFLKRLGAELRATALCRQATPDQRKAILSGLERLVAPHQMGTLFKVLALTSSLDKPAGF